MDITFVILTVVIGVGLIVIEVLFVPGTTIVGILGAVILGVGIYFSYTTFGTNIGHAVLIGSLLLTGIFIYYSFRSGTWKWLANDSFIDSKVTQKDQDKLKAGMEGKTISVLRPMGTAMFGGNYYEVESEGSFIAENTTVTILEIQNNRIIVEPKNI